MKAWEMCELMIEGMCYWESYSDKDQRIVWICYYVAQKRYGYYGYFMRMFVFSYMFYMSYLAFCPKSYPDVGFDPFQYACYYDGYYSRFIVLLFCVDA